MTSVRTERHYGTKKDLDKRIERCARSMKHGTEVTTLYEIYTDREIKAARALVRDGKRPDEKQKVMFGRPVRVFVYRHPHRT